MTGELERGRGGDAGWMGESLREGTPNAAGSEARSWEPGGAPGLCGRCGSSAASRGATFVASCGSSGGVEHVGIRAKYYGGRGVEAEGGGSDGGGDVPLGEKGSPPVARE